MKFKEKFNKKYFKLSFKNIALFLFVWLSTGFSLGTVTLLGPVRWVVNLSKSMRFSQTTEDLLIKIVILLFVLISFYLSLLITRLLVHKFSSLKKAVAFIVLIAITSGFVWVWMHPALIQFERGEISEESYGNVQFVFGPYPTREDLIKLKSEGFAAVISLLHPAVIPFEPKLIADEEDAAKEVGIKLIQAPMLPWVSENKSAIEKIKKIAENGSGKYYVHCYLGKDRVNVIKRIIQQYIAANVTSDDSLQRKLTDLGKFERGKIIELDKDVYLTPFPTDDEFFGYILNGSFKRVVSFLNPKNPEDTMWINREEKICKTNLMPYELLPIEMYPFNAYKILEIANKVKQMPKPILIHAFLTKSPQADAFIKAYKTGLPSLTSYLFDLPMEHGNVELIAPNVLTGPNPTGREFGAYLQQKGIRNILFIGDERAANARFDKKIATGIGLKWYSATSIDNNITELIQSGGPWYIYTPTHEKLADIIKEKLNVDEDDELLSVAY
ncbi:hypothetical protein BMS3Abin03_00676 [bacterium BMS3Abin03]|nr:hypothetical protein BMS3Abin03_00676 [bacterium BMS3Abin03]